MTPGGDPDSALMRAILQRIATGPELSKNISREEACAGMRLVLDEKVDPVQAGVFLIALRMKRETDDELRGLLDALREATRTVTADVDQLIDVGDPYDGYARTLPIAAFLPAILSACGVAAVSHGVESMGPKHGVTHAQVLRAAGVPIDLSMEQAAAQLADPAVGWAYVDQRVYCPKLYRLATLRSLIVKRPALTTAEVLLRPLRGRDKTHALTGYVHKAYPRIYALLARAAGFDSALIVRGVEGGVIPMLRHEGKYVSYHGDDDEREHRITPADFGLGESVVAPTVSESSPNADAEPVSIDAGALALATVDEGLRARDGDAGPIRDNLLTAAALCLYHLRRYSTLIAAASAVRAVLDDGTARRRFTGAR
jgi:anthranilate phosphoribosyltransferase